MVRSVFGSGGLRVPSVVACTCVPGYCYIISLSFFLSLSPCIHYWGAQRIFGMPPYIFLAPIFFTVYSRGRMDRPISLEYCLLSLYSPIPVLISGDIAHMISHISHNISHKISLISHWSDIWTFSGEILKSFEQLASLWNINIQHFKIHRNIILELTTALPWQITCSSFVITIFKVKLKFFFVQDKNNKRMFRTLCCSLFISAKTC